jgi:hypothetical protein
MDTPQHDYSAFGDQPFTSPLNEEQLLMKVAELEGKLHARDEAIKAARTRNQFLVDLLEAVKDLITAKSTDTEAAALMTAAFNVADLRKEDDWPAHSYDLVDRLWKIMDKMPRHGAKHSMDAFLSAGHEYGIALHESAVDHHQHPDDVADKFMLLMLTAMRAAARQHVTLSHLEFAARRVEKKEV